MIVPQQGAPLTPVLNIAICFQIINIKICQSLEKNNFGIDKVDLCLNLLNHS